MRVPARATVISYQPIAASGASKDPDPAVARVAGPDLDVPHMPAPVMPSHITQWRSLDAPGHGVRRLSEARLGSAPAPARADRYARRRAVRSWTRGPPAGKAEKSSVIAVAIPRSASGFAPRPHPTAGPVGKAWGGDRPRPAVQSGPQHTARPTGSKRTCAREQEKWLQRALSVSAPDRIRTCDLRFRRASPANDSWLYGAKPSAAAAPFREVSGRPVRSVPDPPDSRPSTTIRTACLRSPSVPTPALLRQGRPAAM